MAAALAEVVLKKLGSLAADQAAILFGLKSEISKLQSTVLVIQAVLLDAEEQSNHNHQVQQWLRELDEVLYDAEDLIDDLSTEALRRKKMDGNLITNEVNIFFSPSNQVVYGLKMASQIKAILRKLNEIDQNRKQFDFQMRPVNPNPLVAAKDWRQTHSSVPDVVVGREDEKQRIIDMLLLSSYKEKVVVIPIVGMGGLGKTTLSQLIYNDDRIRSHFECKYWVCVSDNFEPKLLIRSILESITRKKVEDLALNTLKDLLHEKIKNKRLFLVLDDVWNEDTEKWVRFKSIFSSVATESCRILVTTRLRIVGKMTATEAIGSQELEGLSQLESWTLFETLAFKGASPGPRYVEIGKEIVGKCRGVPLAIRTIGGLLYFKDTTSEWEAIKENKLLSLESVEQGRDILTATLKLSYDNLPAHLKSCFVYCSLFPKDHVIDVKMLVQLWMAQGYIVMSGKLSHLEEAGVEQFKNLLWRSFFQEVAKDEWNNIKSCKMHDLIHDLAVTVAGEDTLILSASNLTDSFLGSGNVNLERIRHLSIDCKGWWRMEWRFPTSLFKATKLRTFIVINIEQGVFQLEGGCKMIFSNMTRLRVLGLHKLRLKILPRTVHKLKHLRYLDLFESEIQLLPGNITELVNLQLLCLDGCRKLKQLPKDIAKLSNLAYLGLYGCRSLTCMPVGIGKLSHLRELSTFVISEAAAGVDELKCLNHLSGTLCITAFEWTRDKSEAEAANLKEKSHIQSLKLEWRGYTSASRGGDDNLDTFDHEESVLEALQPHVNLKKIVLWGYGGRSLPVSWFSSLRHVVQIKLEWCKKLQSLPSLDPFVFLQALELCGLQSLEYVQSGTRIQSSPSPSLQFLPSLNSLKISYCANLIGWSPTRKELPLLSHVSKLSIVNCPKLEMLVRFSVHFENVEFADDIRSELLSEFGSSLSLPTPPVHPQFRFLMIRDMRDLRFLPERLLPQLAASLESLSIWRCNNLATLPPHILRHLPSLKKLQIQNCGALKLEDDEDNDCFYDENSNMPPGVLPSLRILEVSGLHKLVNLPKWLQHSSNLQQLKIENCNNLECLLSWLKKLTALESLVIFGCRVLSGRCRSNKGMDWSNIAHIPNVSVERLTIQQAGHYLGASEKQEAAAEAYEEERRRRHLYMEEEEEETSSVTRFSRMFGNCIGRLTGNIFQRCFLP